MIASPLVVVHNGSMIETVGIIGGGQLGRMLTQAAKPLGFEVVVVDPVEHCPAAQVGAEQIVAPLVDREAITQLAERSDVLTWEIEHIPAEFLAQLTDEGVNIQPNPRTLSIIQDKLTQKRMLDSYGVPVMPFGVDETVGPGPFVVKTRRGGFDGRGNLVVDTLDDPRIAEKFAGVDTYVEQVVDFDKEVSVIMARDMYGRMAMYPLAETVHKDNICHTVVSPADVPQRVRDNASEVGHETLRLLHGAGVFAVEMFVVGDDVFVNEIAPRVHNSGHHTIEACTTSQFEQHIRAITRMPLGSVEMRSPAAAMVNILGTREEALHRHGLGRLLALPDTHPHFYGKSSRPARKIGHITTLGSSIECVRHVAEQARKELAL